MMSREIKNILIIDDSEATVNYNKRLIQRQEIEVNVDITMNGKDALEYIVKVNNESFPDLIILDLNMPLLGGLGFLKKWEELIVEEQRKNTLIAFLSASSRESDIEKTKEFSGLSMFLSKPLTVEKLSMIKEKYRSQF